MEDECGSPTMGNHRTTSGRRELLVLIVLLATVAAAFVTLTADVWHANRPVGLDRFAASFGIVSGEEGRLDGHRRVARMAEQLGSREGVGLATAALVGMALLWRQWVAGLVALVAPLACFALTEYVAKPIINLPVPFGGRAYPSGHGAGVAAVVVSALVLIYRRYGGLTAAILAPLALAAEVSVGFGVLALRLHHYPTDVLGGALLGAMIVLILTAVLSWAAGHER